MKRVAIVTLCVLAILVGCRRDMTSNSGQVVLRIDADSVATSLAINQQLATEFERKTGAHIEIIKGPASASERLSQYLQYLGAKSPDIDIYQIDVIWPGMLAEHFIDLKPYFTPQELAAYFPSLLDNNTVAGRLVALPWFADAGMLYYRKDLLVAYGYQQPPARWDELGAMAERIQKAERAAGKRDIWGFVFQGRAYEGLTCDALEWQASSGGGRIIEQDGRISVNNPPTIRAFSRARGWIGTICPPGVTTYEEEEARHLFQEGNAVFMRNWPYAYSLANASDSPVRGKIDVTLLPTGGAGHMACLGGWQLSVSRYSPHQREAVEFVRFLASEYAEKLRAVKMSLLPSRMGLYEDKEVAAAIPFLASMKKTFLEAVPRPSNAAGEKYNEVSTRYFQAIHRVLTGSRSAEDAMRELDQTLREVMAR